VLAVVVSQDLMALLLLHHQVLLVGGIIKLGKDVAGADARKPLGF